MGTISSAPQCWAIDHQGHNDVHEIELRGGTQQEISGLVLHSFRNENTPTQLLVAAESWLYVGSMKKRIRIALLFFALPRRRVSTASSYQSAGPLFDW